MHIHATVIVQMIANVALEIATADVTKEIVIAKITVVVDVKIKILNKIVLICKLILIKNCYIYY